MNFSIHEKILWIALSLLTALMVFIITYSAYYIHDLSGTRREEQVAGCLRANVQRTYINAIILHHPDFDLPPIAIPDCEKIIR